jgi:hypothetical protein
LTGGGGAFSWEFSKEIVRLNAAPVPLADALSFIDKGHVDIIMLRPESRGSAERWYELLHSDGTSDRWRVEGIDVVVAGRGIDERPVLGAKEGAVGVRRDEWCLLLRQVADYNLRGSAKIEVLDERQSLYEPLPREIGPPPASECAESTLPAQ